ncbi:MRC1 protein, partial [Glaucidium brasilianum]|nr:MRC1 protein [Glaucidium brasilianum]
EYLQSSSVCFLLGGTLASVEDLAESHFLVEHAYLYTSKTSGFWIGLYRNVNGQLLWQDNSTLDFVNWAEGQPSEEQLDYCVELSAFSGYWSILPCSSQKGFICKKPEIHPLLFALYLFTDAQKDKPHGHMNMWILLTLILIILLGMGFMIYFLFKNKTQSETEREVRQYSTLLEYSHVLTGRDNENDSTNDKEKNEYSVV